MSREGAKRRQLKGLHHNADVKKSSILHYQLQRPVSIYTPAPPALMQLVVIHELDEMMKKLQEKHHKS